MSHTGKQSVKCSVNTCRHYFDGVCSLKSIKVTPDAAAPKVDSAVKSMCSSFEYIH